MCSPTFRLVTVGLSPRRLLMHADTSRNADGRSAAELPLAVCCEPDCTEPTAPWSRVRCVEHYTPPEFAGHAPFNRPTWSSYPCRWPGCTDSRTRFNAVYCATHKRAARLATHTRYNRKRVSHDNPTS